MGRIESGCVSCGAPCMGDYCTKKRTRILVCDECGDDEVQALYDPGDGRELCEECLLEATRIEW